MQTSQVNADIYTVCRKFSHGGSRVQMVFRIFRILRSAQSVGVHSIFGTPVIDMCRRAQYFVHMLSELLSQSVGVHSTFDRPVIDMCRRAQYLVDGRSSKCRCAQHSLDPVVRICRRARYLPHIRL